jgi:hypothetical protein
MGNSLTRRRSLAAVCAGTALAGPTGTPALARPNGIVNSLPLSASDKHQSAALHNLAAAFRPRLNSEESHG